MHGAKNVTTKSLFLAISLFASVSAAQRPVFTVAADGTAAYKTVQAAVDAAGEQGAEIRIKTGTYREKLVIKSAHIALVGTGATAKDVVLTYDDSAASAGGTGKSGSVNVSGDDFSARNLTIENSWERTHTRSEEGSQAVALLVTGDRAVFERVRLLGFQDTLYAASKTCHAKEDAAAGPCQASRQYFHDCYIEGHVDFIFGDAKAVFDHCELHGMKHATVMLTAQSKLFPDEDSGYLFLDCTVTADAGAEKIVLGRPWRPYSTVMFVNTKLRGAAIAPEGWSDWAGKLATSNYAEYNTGPGADVRQRIAGTRQLTQAEAAKLTVAFWLQGNDGWNPAAASAKPTGRKR